MPAREIMDLVYVTEVKFKLLSYIPLLNTVPTFIGTKVQQADYIIVCLKLIELSPLDC